MNFHIIYDLGKCTCPDPLPTTLGTLRLINKDCPVHGQGAKA